MTDAIDYLEGYLKGKADGAKEVMDWVEDKLPKTLANYVGFWQMWQAQKKNWGDIMTKTEEFDERLDVAGFSKEERDTIKLVSKEAGLAFVNKDTKFGEFTPINQLEVE